jgi:GT2 family glycosyltransferase
MTTREWSGLVHRGSQVADSPLVSVCVLMLTDPAMAMRCLEALSHDNRPDGIESIVVANGTTATARAAIEARDDVVLVRSGTNLGFAGGNNLAVDIARGRYVLFLNDDSTVEKGYIDRLVATAESDPSIGAVGGRILSSDGSMQEAGSVLWSDGWATHVGDGEPGDTTRFSYVRDVDYLSANGLLVRRTAWEAVGGFDEQYFPAYFEDTDLCMRLRQQGFRVVYEPRARLVHLEGQSTSRRYRNFLLRRNHRLFVDKWAEELGALDNRPTRPDEVAVERAIHRARGWPPRVLVISEGVGTGADPLLWDVAEELASEGWAVTMASPVAGQGPVVPPPTREDRVADLGIDTGHDLAGALATVGGEFEAVVVGAGPQPEPIVRSDKTLVPVVAVPRGGGVSAVQSTVRDVLEGARRSPTTS